ncbi:hypothetical protein D3C87_1843290 [compost metagenome]
MQCKEVRWESGPVRGAIVLKIAKARKFRLLGVTQVQGVSGSGISAGTFRNIIQY